MEYLILDCDQSSLTRGTLRSPVTASLLEFEFPQGDIPRLEEIDGDTPLQFIGFDESSPSFIGKVNRRRGNRLAVERGTDLGEDPREDLRAPFYFASYVYPVSGGWKGRASIEINDISCGGLGFTCEKVLATHEMVELAVPVSTMAAPLLVQGKIIRPLAGDIQVPGTPIHYVAKFISGVDEVETAIRKEVLKQQLNQRDNKGGASKRKILFKEDCG